MLLVGHGWHFQECITMCTAWWIRVSIIVKEPHIIVVSGRCDTCHNILTVIRMYSVLTSKRYIKFQKFQFDNTALWCKNNECYIGIGGVVVRVTRRWKNLQVVYILQNNCRSFICDWKYREEELPIYVWNLKERTRKVKFIRNLVWCSHRLAL